MNLDKRALTPNDICEMQNELNAIIDSNWVENRNKDDFLTQIIDELAEFLGSGIEYKWWKHTPEDQFNLHNARIELVDIVHFAASICIMSEGEPNKKPIRISGNDRLIVDGNKINFKMYSWLVQCLVNLLDSFEPQSQLEYIIGLMCSGTYMSVAEFSALYVCKYNLNIIRQDQGYKSGEYVKVQDGVEDNERLKRVVEDFMENEDMMLADIKDKVWGEFFQKVA